MKFGERMQARREELGLSRAELAALLGVSPSAISNYEKNISFPKEEIILRLFDCLQTDPNTLFQDSFRAGGQVLTHSERQLLEHYRLFSFSLEVKSAASPSIRAVTKSASPSATGIGDRGWGG